jgi:hypothetical protein
MKPIAGACHRNLPAQSMHILEEQYVKRAFLPDYIL